MNFDWTAISLAGMAAVISAVGWLAKQSFGKLDKHMTRVERFMEETGKTQAVMQVEIKHHAEKFSGQERWIQSVEQRINDSRRIGEIHAMTSDIHERGCGPAIQLERGTV